MAKSIGQAFKVTNYDPIDVRLVVDNASSLGVVVNGSLAYLSAPNWVLTYNCYKCLYILDEVSPLSLYNDLFVSCCSF